MNNTMTIQIFNNNTNNYQDYICAEPDINDDIISIHGWYFGSSTRQGELGTFYFGETKEIIPLKIRIIDNKTDTKLLEFDFNYQKDPESMVLNRLNINDNLVLHYRDLHRFDNYPFEISGISFKLLHL